jgi:hypothetical protein
MLTRMTGCTQHAWREPKASDDGGGHCKFRGARAAPAVLSPMQSVLLRYRHPRNLIIDSPTAAAPHIVITEAEVTWDVLFVAALNRADCRQPHCLRAPDVPRGYDTRALHPQAEAAAFIPSTKRRHHELEDSTPSPRPRRRRRLPPMFSQTQFQETVGVHTALIERGLTTLQIDFAVWDREYYPDLVTALHRRLFRLSVSPFLRVTTSLSD